MDLNSIITNIELMDNKTDKCLAYSEMILYLQALGEAIGFKETGVAWKDAINNMIRQDSIDDINKQIKILRNMIEFNVKH